MFCSCSSSSEKLYSSFYFLFIHDLMNIVTEGSGKKSGGKI